MSDDKLRDDDKPLAENTETICLEIVKVLGIANFDIHSYEQSFDLLNCVAAFAMRCEEDGRSFQRLIDKTKSLEVKNGFEPDRRATADAPPEVTEEMVAAGAARLHIRWGYIFFHETAELSNEATQDILRAALAAAQKEG